MEDRKCARTVLLMGRGKPLLKDEVDGLVHFSRIVV